MIAMLIINHHQQRGNTVPQNVDPKIAVAQSDLEALLNGFYAGLTTVEIAQNSKKSLGAAQRITEAIYAFHKAEDEMFLDYLKERAIRTAAK